MLSPLRLLLIGSAVMLPALAGAGVPVGEINASHADRSQVEARPLVTGQTDCDGGNGRLGSCASAQPAEQDGSLSKGVRHDYVDNRDGTITDRATGLMWETLVKDASIHDGDRLYSWYEALDAKIRALNTGPGFAGHKDWRLPNVNELHSLVDYGRRNPSIDPLFNRAGDNCADSNCSETKPFHYWSSTSSQARGSSAWLVSFEGGYVITDAKTNLYYARAVRDQ